jgi:ribulose-phosphate 3-epimerase
MKYFLGYSIIANNLLDINDIVQKNDYIDFLHIDVMDGNFVPALTIGPGYISNLIEKLNKKIFIDVHLMVNSPKNYIQQLKQVDRIIFHYEKLSTSEINLIITDIKNLNIKCGISISPSTPIEKLDPFLEEIDLVQIMTVEPGKCGQKLIPECLDKIAYLKSKNLEFDIQVDGGINLSNIDTLITNGANSFICGSSMLKEGNLISNKIRWTKKY